MNQLEKRYVLVVRALNSLGEALVHFDTVDENYASIKDHFDRDNVVRTCRDSVFQRFEYSSHLFLEYFKKHLVRSLGVSKIRSINDSIKKAEKEGVLSQNEARVLVVIVESRKLLPCACDGEVVEQLIREIPGYYKTLLSLVERIKSK